MSKMVAWYMRSVIKQQERVMATRVRDVCVMLVRETVDSIQERRGPTKSTPDNPPSKPGEPPRTRTGHLARAIDFEIERSLVMGPVGHVGWNNKLVYGPPLELGNEAGTLEARPHLVPALERNLPVVRRMLGVT